MLRDGTPVRNNILENPVGAYSFVPSFFLTAALSRKVEGLGPLKPWQPAWSFDLVRC